jgi:hypothetical protein
MIFFIGNSSEIFEFLWRTAKHAENGHLGEDPHLERDNVGMHEGALAWRMLCLSSTDGPEVEASSQMHASDAQGKQGRLVDAWPVRYHNRMSWKSNAQCHNGLFPGTGNFSNAMHLHFAIQEANFPHMTSSVLSLRGSMGVLRAGIIAGIRD